jgi:hypothetical protein
MRDGIGRAMDGEGNAYSVLVGKSEGKRTPLGTLDC